MKAILIVDMPNDCDECPLNSNGYCDVLQEDALLNEWVEDAPYYSLKEKGDCPLKPMPKKMLALVRIQNGNIINIQETSFANGWNVCLDEITGEQND